ncbi:MAG: peptidase T [Candidatus Izemoplasmatales bacterium]|nr:peptidase T [Candidatus Izemoplasmatales bacterium]
MKLVERFLEYVKYDTQSKPESNTYPSTDKQWHLARKIFADLKTMGVQSTIDEYGYVIGTIFGNTLKKTPKLAFIAHYDTSPDASGENIKPRIIHKYDGLKIILNNENDCIMDPAIFKTLSRGINHDLIVTDGSTLLGADDKAGVAEIMTIVEFLTVNPSFPHGDITVVFTPDEEVGNGTKYLDISKINADFGYTLDGSCVGEIAFENFNAASVVVTINGKSVHPGSAKNMMINSISVACEFDCLLPQLMRPEATEKYEGFNHLHGINGVCEKTTMAYLIRNHDKNIFERQKQDFHNAADFINKKYGYTACEINIEDSYYNMRDKLEASMYIVDIAKEAIVEAGLEPIIEPIRGGTDGARLTFLGLPCPNLGTGGYNYHGPFEYADINEMMISVEIVKKIISKVANL